MTDARRRGLTNVVRGLTNVVWGLTRVVGN
jgi:hypothetical protein